MTSVVDGSREMASSSTGCSRVEEALQLTGGSAEQPSDSGEAKAKGPPERYRNAFARAIIPQWSPAPPRLSPIPPLHTTTLPTRSSVRSALCVLVIACSRSCLTSPIDMRATPTTIHLQRIPLPGSRDVT